MVECPEAAAIDSAKRKRRPPSQGSMSFLKSNQPRGFAVYRIAAKRVLRRIFERKLACLGPELCITK
jgi:hypothetical protein